MVVDTGIFIEHLRAKDKTATSLYRISGGEDLYISSITLYELFMGATTPEKMADIQHLTTDLTILPFDETVAKTAAEIYHELKKRNQLIEFRDIFIAATALSNNFPIATLNKKHFKRVDKLKILR